MSQEDNVNVIGILTEKGLFFLKKCIISSILC